MTELWTKCGGCGDVIFARRYEHDLHVCPGCGHHAALSAPERVETLLDPGSGRPIVTVAPPEDPLTFSDRRGYRVRLAEAREQTGLEEAIVCLRGEVGGRPLVIGVMDFRFMGGSLGIAVGERIAAAAGVALRDRIPLLLVCASGGARMQEGGFALMQMAKTSQALSRLDDAGILTVSLITDPTYGGVAASYALLTDVVIAEPGSRLGFAGPRVIEQTVRRKLPEGFQRAEFLLDHGAVDTIQPRGGLRFFLSRLLGLVSESRPGGMAHNAAAVVRDPGRVVAPTPMETVRRAREPGRPTALDYARTMLDDFEELHGDRMAADCPTIVAGIGRIDRRPLVLIGHEKGHGLAEHNRRNYGMARPQGHRKAVRLMRLAAKLGLPVVTLINTPGADPGPDSEANGQAASIAACLRTMGALPVPTVAVITGEGGSGGALALGVADRVLAMENAFYSVISPEGCASILWRSPDASARAAEALRLGARDLLAAGIVDGVIPEPAGGAHTDPLGAAEAVRQAVTGELTDLLPLPAADLVSARRERFGGLGTTRLPKG